MPSKTQTLMTECVLGASPDSPIQAEPLQLRHAGTNPAGRPITAKSVTNQAGPVNGPNEKGSRALCANRATHMNMRMAQITALTSRAGFRCAFDAFTAKESPGF